MRGLGQRLLVFWATRTTGEATALFRIALGLLSLWATLGVALNLDRWFGFEGALPWSALEPDSSARYSLIALAPDSDALLGALIGLAMLASVAMTVGLWPRVSAFVTWAVMVMFRARNPHIQNGGDRLFLILLLLSIFVPLGHAWSVDAWRRAKKALPPPPAPSAWALRLLQLQIAFVYACTGILKLGHASWREGRIMKDVFESPVYATHPTTIDSHLLVGLLTYGTLVFELGFPVAVWWRRLRLPVLAAGLLLHGGIELTMSIPMFGAVMMVSYLAFLRDEEVRGGVGWLSRRLRGA